VHFVDGRIDSDTPTAELAIPPAPPVAVS